MCVPAGKLALGQGTQAQGRLAGWWQTSPWPHDSGTSAPFTISQSQGEGHRVPSMVLASRLGQAALDLQALPCDTCLSGLVQGAPGSRLLERSLLLYFIKGKCVIGSRTPNFTSGPFEQTVFVGESLLSCVLMAFAFGGQPP